MRSLILTLEPVQRSEDGCGMRKFRSFNRGYACKTVLNLEAVFIWDSYRELK